MIPEVICGELRTGRILTTVPAASASWGVKFNDAGDVSCDVPLRSLPLSDATELVGYLDPARCFLGVRVGDRLLEAGPIWAHDWNEDTGVLSVKAAGLWSLFDHRKVLAVLAPGESVAGSSLTWAALGLGTIAKRLVESAEAHTGGSLPIVFQADETAAADEDHTRTYPGHLLKRTGDALRDLTGVINGPDIDFAPRLTADRLGIEWVMRTGTEAQPALYQTGDDWVWDSNVPRSSVSGLSVRRDATQLGFRAHVPGSGIEADQPIAVAEDLTLTGLAGYPLLEVDESHSSVTEQATLDAHAAALIARSVRPWTTWSWTARAGDAPLLGDYRPGDWAQVNVPTTHPYLSALGIAGRYRTRIMGFAGDLGDTVSITAAPTMEAR